MDSYVLVSVENRDSFNCLSFISPMGKSHATRGPDFMFHASNDIFIEKSKKTCVSSKKVETPMCKGLAVEDSSKKVDSETPSSKGL